ncbi:hypothetical protein JX266_008379 [Neoarthrinium moseri]|nr:hypothetical protein JX266_008379 [Neoarthrinium moseri]
MPSSDKNRASSINADVEMVERVLPSSQVAHTTWKNYAFTFVVCFGSLIYGYSSNVIAGALALPSFTNRLLLPDVDPRTSGLVGIFFAGGAFGAVIQQPLSDRYGRRFAMASSGIFQVIGAALGAGSYHYAMFIISRFFAGIGSAISLTLPPVFISELAPPQSRGRLVSFHVVFLNLGYLTSALGSLGFSYISQNYQWRLNFIVNTALSLLLVFLIYTIPESPRWLVSQDRVDEAAKILKNLHQNDSDPDGDFAHHELLQIQQRFEEARHLPSGYRHILATRSHRKRALCTILVWVTGMSTGVLVISVYSTVLFAGLGYDSSGSQFAMSAGWLCCCIIFAGLGGLFVDRVGRVRMMAMGGLTCAATLAIECAMQAKYLGTTNKAGNAVGVTAFFLFAAAYNGFYDAGSFVYTSEIWPNHLRSEGVTIAMVTFYLTNVAWSSPASIALASIGWRYYIVFICVSVVLSFALLAYLPEVKGLTLEEVGIKFQDEVPTQAVHKCEVRSEEKGMKEI